VDIIFTVNGPFLKPVVLGLHPTLCLQSSFPELEGCGRGTEGCQGTLLLTPFTRSHVYLMQGRTVLVVGAGAHSKKFIWEQAQRYKLKVMELSIQNH